MAKRMKKISETKLKEVKENIIHDGSYILKEAFRLRISDIELIAQLEGFFTGGKKNTQYKAVITTSERNMENVPEEELEKMRILPEPEKKKQNRINKIPQIVEKEKTEKTKGNLVSKKEGLQRELESNLSALFVAHKTLQTRKGLKEEARKSLEEADRKLKEAEWILAKAEEKVKQTERALKKVEEDIQSSKVYLVDPWFQGTLPERGKFISTREIPRCTQEEPSEESLQPDIMEMKKTGFKVLDDYEEGLKFVTLCEEYILKNVEYILLSTDERLSRLMKIRIG